MVAFTLSQNRKHIFLLILIPLLWRGADGRLFSQNLVPNNSFENITSCPWFSQIYLAPPWFQPCTHLGNTTNSSSSELFDTCASYTDVGVPANNLGFQHPINGGHGYAGFYLHADTFNYREYLEVPLFSPLVANRKYCVEFYVSLSYPTIAISNCGAYFSTDSLLDTTNLHTINYVTPQIQNPNTNMLSDTSNWMLISGNFIANGGEKFMTIGNFDLPANTHTQNLGTGGTIAYYYVDDISVIDCDTTDVGVNEIKQKDGGYGLFPNPNSGNMQLSYSLADNETGYVTISSLMGAKLASYKLVNGSTILNIKEPSLQNGVYLYQIYKNNVRGYFVGA